MTKPAKLPSRTALGTTNGNQAQPVPKALHWQADNNFEAPLKQPDIERVIVLFAFRLARKMVTNS
jgi:hypothetical protein